MYIYANFLILLLAYINIFSLLLYSELLLKFSVPQIQSGRRYGYPAEDGNDNATVASDRSEVYLKPIKCENLTRANFT